MEKGVDTGGYHRGPAPGRENKYHCVRVGKSPRRVGGIVKHGRDPAERGRRPTGSDETRECLLGASIMSRPELLDGNHLGTRGKRKKIDEGGMRLTSWLPL